MKYSSHHTHGEHSTEEQEPGCEALHLRDESNEEEHEEEVEGHRTGPVPDQGEVGEEGAYEEGEVGDAEEEVLEVITLLPQISLLQIQCPTQGAVVRCDHDGRREGDHGDDSCDHEANRHGG